MRKSSHLLSAFLGTIKKHPVNTAPEIKPVSVSDLALPYMRVMPNGVPLYELTGMRKGVVRLDILFKGGYGVQDKPLQAMFVNRMLREGAGGLSADDISRKLDYYGAWVDMYSSQGCNHLTLYSMSKHFLPLVELLDTLIKRPDFSVDNLETVKRTNKSYFMVNSHKVDVVSQRYFENSLWGEAHPLAHIVCPEDYDAITREDLLDYYTKVYNSHNCSIFVAGEFDDVMLDALQDKFGKEEWGAGSLLADVVVAPPCSLCCRRNVTVEGAMQSCVKIGFMSMDSSHPDYCIFRFLTVLLGGYFGSRLMSNVREENGYTYHIEAEMDAYGQRNAFMITSETDNANVELLVKEVYKELRRLVNEPIPDSEVKLVRSYVLGELCREYEERFAKSEVFINAWLSGESFESVNKYLETVRTVTAADLQRVAKEVLDRDEMIEIVVGE